ncbi:hypothetical protein CFE70_005550 [Pyrenophora teres f. teres 0-1]
MSSRLLELPRELRDLIYEFVLVRDVIPIQRAAAALDNIPEETRTRCPEFYRQAALTYPLRRTHAHRRTWAIPRFDIRISNSRYDPGDLPTDVQMTYQLEDDYDEPWTHKFEPRLLQTCRQIYDEAREVFYGKNLFSFTDTEAIPTAFAFLCDRPAESLKLISAMELAFDEGSNMIGTAGAHYPIQAKSTDSLVLRYAYHFFPDLCTLLSTPRMQLRRLNLTINSLSQHLRIMGDAEDEDFASMGRFMGSAVAESEESRIPRDKLDVRSARGVPNGRHFVVDGAAHAWGEI